MTTVTHRWLKLIVFSAWSNGQSWKNEISMQWTPLWMHIPNRYPNDSYCRSTRSTSCDIICWSVLGNSCVCEGVTLSLTSLCSKDTKWSETQCPFILVYHTQVHVLNSALLQSWNVFSWANLPFLQVLVQTRHFGRCAGGKEKALQASNFSKTMGNRFRSDSVYCCIDHILP